MEYAQHHFDLWCYEFISVSSHVMCLWRRRYWYLKIWPTVVVALSYEFLLLYWVILLPTGPLDVKSSISIDVHHPSMFLIGKFCPQPICYTWQYNHFTVPPFFIPIICQDRCNAPRLSLPCSGYYIWSHICSSPLIFPAGSYLPLLSHGNQN